jgi:hypothetical protein
LHAESWLRGYKVNDPKLSDIPPPYACFLSDYNSVLAARKQLLALAGLKPDPPLYWCRSCGTINMDAKAVRDPDYARLERAG